MSKMSKILKCSSFFPSPNQTVSIGAQGLRPFSLVILRCGLGTTYTKRSFKVLIHQNPMVQITRNWNEFLGVGFFFSVGCMLSHMCILTHCTELAIPLRVSCIIYMHGKAVFRADRRMEILYLTQI